MAAAQCADFASQRRQLLDEEADRAFQAAGGSAKLSDYQVTELKEIYLPVDRKRFKGFWGTTAGYVDLVLLNYNQSYAEAFDWKFGVWPVEQPKDNLQVIAYTLGLFRKYPTLQKVKFWIKQPYLDITKDADFTRKEMPEMYLRVQTAAARARKARESNNFATARPAVPVCNFCSRLGECPRVCELACKVGAKFHPTEIPAEITPELVTRPDQATLGIRLAGVLKVWAEAFRRVITDRVVRGDMQVPEGFKVQQIQKRELVDMAKLKAVALTRLTQAEFDSTLETTFGALETIVKDKAPRGTKSQAVEQFQQELEQAGATVKGEPITFLRAVAQ